LHLTDGKRLVLVTGANGFVGSHLTEALLARGYRVRCMVRESSDLQYVEHLPVEWVRADLRGADLRDADPALAESLEHACRGVDMVCHCAALTRAVDEETFLRVNARGTEALARAAMEASPSLQRFLYISSQTAAGYADGPDDYLDESRPPRPLDWYGKSKWAAEQALHALGERLPLTIIRPTVVFGPRDRDVYTYFDLVNKHLELSLGREERWVSLIYVRDLVDLIILALESEAAVGQTYFATGWATTYTRVGRIVARVMDKRTLRVTVPLLALEPIVLVAKVQERLTGKPALLNEQRVLNMRQPYLLCSGEKAQQELGFAPGYDLETALAETAAWYREHGWL
jgi:nucleoside-diphosphate-sugar epimerase